MKKIIAAILGLVLIMSLAACGQNKTSDNSSGSEEKAEVFKVGICNYVDDASLNQIVDNIQSRLDEIEKEENVVFEVDYDNCNADANVMAQIIADFEASKVDLMVGVATPVAMNMQSATKDSQTPVVFAAVSDPIGTGLVEALDVPGGNITGTSDHLDTNSIFDLIFTADPEAAKIGFLYDAGLDSSTAAIAEAKEYLTERGIEYVEHTGTSVDEVSLAADAMIADNVDAIFTPADNTIMTAELSIYEKLAAAKIPHYAGANSFALNGAFLDYGVDYAELGRETADMIAEILVNRKDPSTLPVRALDNGTVTINTETCEAIGFNFDELKKSFSPFCSAVKKIKTAESFDDLD